MCICLLSPIRGVARPWDGPIASPLSFFCIVRVQEQFVPLAAVQRASYKGRTTSTRVMAPRRAAPRYAALRCAPETDRPTKPEL